MNTSQLSTKQPIILHVAIPSPLRRIFDYLLPTDNSETIPTVGARVSVPFGARTLTGIITNISNNTDLPLDKLKPIIKLLDSEPLFPAKIRELFSWASDYYQYPLGLLFDSALPAWLRKDKILKFTKQKNISSHQSDSENVILNQYQINAIKQVSNSFGDFKTFVLDGITGSGKTEVYMQIIAKIISQKKQVLILIPEINLTPQTLLRFQNRFSVPIAVLHSQIAEKARALAWTQAQDGTALIILGTRLAAFTPLKNPGLFIIDEEHDLSFKQQDHFRYSARDLLLKRAQLEQCPILLGSATPALETWHNIITKRYEHLELPERAGSAQKPQMEVVDIRHNQLNQGLSNYLIQQIKEHIDNKNQVLLFINRRGYAPVLMCFKCGWHQTCKRCDSNMILHYDTQNMRCHHCQAQTSIPKTCPTCNSPEISGVGLGTQRLENTLNQLFPNANISRVDRDTVTSKKQLGKILDSVHDGNTDILIGTQMLAKGHHFPNLSLVAILDIDNALFSADFRATERMGQLITQVAGRAGRGNKLGKVIIQTTQPEHPVLATLIYKDYHAFLDLLMQERKKAKLPPYSFQVLIRSEAKKPKIANEFLSAIKLLITHNNANLNISCLGPIAAPMERRQGYYRSQLLLQADSRKILQIMLKLLTPQIEAHKLARAVRWSIDVDPLDMY